MTHLSPFFCAREQRSMYRYVCLATHPQPLSRVTKIPKKLGMPSLMSNNQSCQYFMGWTYLNAKNLAPFLPPTLWESKIFLGGFWHLSQLKFEEISPKLQRIQILRKLAPPAAPSCPPGSQKFLGRFLIYPNSCLNKYHQKYHECRF